MTKTERQQAANRLQNRYTEIIDQIDSISKYGRRHNLLTTQEIAELDRLDVEYNLIKIEVDTYLADVAASRSPIKFLIRYILRNT